MLISGTLTQARSSRFAGSVNPEAAIANDQRYWPELPVEYILDPTDPRSRMENLTPAQGWMLMYDVLHRTLISPITLPVNFQLPHHFVLSPGAPISVTSTATCTPANQPPSTQRTYQPPVLDQNHFSSSSCFPAGTVFPRETTFSSLFGPFPANVRPIYNGITPQDLPWSTDIAWGSY